MPQARFALILCSVLLAGCKAMTVYSESGSPPDLPPRPEYHVVEPVLPPPVPSRGQVTFYTLPNFRGDSFTVEAGSSLYQLDAWDNDISSFRVEGPVTVMVFSEQRYRGQGFETSTSMADLIAETRGRAQEANWDDVISSLRVIPSRNRDYGPPTNTSVAAVRYDQRSAENVVRRAFREILDREPDPVGFRYYSERLVSGFLTEDALRNHLRSSPEFSRVDHNAFITRAYREILKRDPDADGLEHYRFLMITGGWTESQVRADLFRSAEKSSAAAQVAVTKAYREILRREPDPAGLGNYVGRMVNDGWSEQRVRDTLRNSDEYRRLGSESVPPPAIPPSRREPRNAP